MAEPSASSAAAAPAAAAELTDAERMDALDRMLTRLALADDARLAPVLARVLPYAVTSLASPAPAVRKLVMEILSHINKRVKHRPEIPLPMLELWKIYTESTSSTMVRNFCIVYIEMAFERLPTEEKGNIAPDLLINISNVPAQHQGIILRLVTKAIGECNTHKVDETIASKYRVITQTKDGLVFAEFCFHTLLYQAPLQGSGCPAGLSVAQSERVTGKQPLKIDVLASRKLGILNVIEAMNFAPEIVYPLYLSASSDSQEPVSKKGEEFLKRKTSTVNLEDPNLIKRLFTLFNGTVGAENIAAELKVSPAHASLRMRLMSVFCRSVAAANAFPHTLQCIFGCIYGSGTTSRLKQLGMEFTVWVFKHVLADQLKLIGPVILSGILRSLDGSSTAETDSTGRDTKIFAYQAIGLLASRMPNLFSDKTDMAIRLFTALRLEDQSLRLTIQEAATSLATAYKRASTIVLKDLEVLLLENCEAEQSEVRFSAIRWATTLYDTRHCSSRYICMIGASDVKLDIREMALAGLDLMNDGRQSSAGSGDFSYPDVKEMINYICCQRPQLLHSDEQRNGKLLFPSKTFVSMIKFLMKCFESSDSSNLLQDPSDSAVAKMCVILEHAMSYEGSSELHALALKSLVDLSSREPKLVSLRYAERINWLRTLLGHVDSDAREAASRLLGIASSALSTSSALSLLSELTSTLSQNRPSRFENYHGVLCAIGYLTAGALKQSYISEDMVKNVVDILVKVVISEGSTLASVAMESLGHIGLRCALPSINQNSSTGTLLSVLRERLTKLLSENDTKAQQKILVSLGHISWNEMSFPHLNDALDLIFSLSRSKVEDVLFAAGEALSFIWGEVPVTADVILETNFVSLSQATNYLTGDASLVSSNSYEKSGCEEAHSVAREEIIKKLFETLIYSSRKEERCAGTVWLVSLTMYCGRHKKILELLPQIQEALSHLLGDPNELTQDLASQGMSIVYELGDASMKEELVHALVNTLTGAARKKKAIKLMEDSEVFQEGTIGNNPTGGKLSTYKELCSLANEMGQPDLIYKFMDLANYQAALNSKRGAAFGFSKIAKQAGEALQPYLHTLIPRLVRYQHDPDKNIQDSMAHIWKLIVSDPKKAIDEHYDAIVEDLLVQSGSRLWRSREASCLALADIIQGRRYSQVCKHLRKIWTTTFRAMDDIKETVRTAGDSLCRAVSSLTIRLCDISLTSTSDANETMSIVLPYLLSEGILSKVPSVQKAAISLVMKLAKGAGPALRPHLPELVSCMLECLSSLEDQRLNYVEMHAGNVGIKTDKLESLRIAVAKDSPMWETLDICIKIVDKNSLDLLVPRLAQMVRSAVGLNTRVGVASFITFLVQKVMVDIKPFTTILLKLLYSAVLEERSSAAKKAFASSCATVLKYASPPQAQKLIEDTTSLHSGGKNDQLSGAILIKAYLSNAADILGGYNAVVIPVIFVSRFDDDKDTSALYEELWEDIPTSERVTLTLYLPEIVSLLCDGMSLSSWAGKRKSAKAMKKLCDILGEPLSAHYQNILKSLLKELPGRFWEGKDAILDALASLCSSCHVAITADDSSLPSVILNAVCAACSRKSKLYREAAFLCLHKVIAAFRDPGFFNSVFPMLYEVSSQSVISKTKNSAGAELDESEGASISLDKVLNCATSCISVAFPQDIINQKKNVLELILNSLSPEESWQVKLSSFLCIKELCLKFHSSGDSNTWPQDTACLVQELFHLVSPKLVDSIRLVKIAQVHIAASECLLDLSKLYRDFPLLERTEAKFEDELTELCESEKSEQAKAILKECLAILKTLPGVTMTTD
ncbi:proteasome-associated protein ECM29 homolog isoform X2 [Sorghum bicolor]|uniref:proteasome-associated protein ECM29 homolog isoform X2 n=1 Tax=Sorghum bicolor TaxID=4558 RepID=UPI000B4239ED|nr:proteasome-associated protein ECM29 homolog isoform X2 [Sorghum bicolor]|eukprot:XP_021317324.1 proteasome-associated protein ECM29 homolog isoform X2 [Sorghum bicolor]